MVDESIGGGQSRRREFIRVRSLPLILDFIEAVCEAARASSRKIDLDAKSTAFFHVAIIAGLILVNILFWRDLIGAFGGMRLVGDPHSVACRSLAGAPAKLDTEVRACGE